MNSEQAQRQAVIDEALTWLKTPYHHAARVKGAGVDCLMLLAEVYTAAGVIEPIADIPHYPRDWMLHRNEERYLDGLLSYCHPVAEPKLGDIALFRFGRTVSHGAIVLDWPNILHAYSDEGGVVLSSAANGRLAGRLAGFYSPWVAA